MDTSRGEYIVWSVLKLIMNTSVHQTKTNAPYVITNTDCLLKTINKMHITLTLCHSLVTNTMSQPCH